MRIAAVLFLSFGGVRLPAQTAPVVAVKANGWLRLVKPGKTECSRNDEPPQSEGYYVVAISTVTKTVIGARSGKDGEITFSPQRTGSGDWLVQVLEDARVQQIGTNTFKPAGSGLERMLRAENVCIQEFKVGGQAPARGTGLARHFLPPGLFFDQPAPAPWNSAAVLKGEISDGQNAAPASVRLFGLSAGTPAMAELGQQQANGKGEFEFRLSDPAYGNYSLFVISALGKRGAWASQFVRPEEVSAKVKLSLARETAEPSAASVNSFSQSRGVLFLARELTDLPLPSPRSYDSLALLAPGIALAPRTLGQSGPGLGPGIGTAGQFSANGLPSRENNFMVDGADNNDEEVGVRRQGFVVAVSQAPDSVGEVEVISALADARYGRSIGARVNTLSASGSRAAHGSLYGFFGDRRLNARNFFDSEPRPGITALTRAGDGAPVLLNGAPLAQRNPVASETPFTRFETGAVVSTPLGKPDSPKTFAVAALDWQRTRAAEQSHFAVPAVDDRGYENTGGRGISPGTAGNATPLYPASLAGDAVFSLFPFPNNLSGPYGRKTYTAVLPADADAWMGSGKIDRYFHGKLDHSLALRYAASHEDSVLPSTGGGLYSAIKPSVRTRNLASFLNTNLTPQVVNSFRFSWGDSRFAFGELRDSSLSPSSAFPGEAFLLNKPLLLNTTAPGSPQAVFGVPEAGSPIPYRTTEEVTGPIGQLKVAGFSPIGVDSYRFPQTRGDSTFQWSDSLTVTRGRASYVTGFDIWYTRLDSDVNRNARPLVEFWGQRLQFPGPAALYDPGAQPEPLLGPASFAAMGVPQALRQTAAAVADSSLRLHRKQIDFLVQNTYRLGRNVRLIAGVRVMLNRLPESDDLRFEKSFDRNLFESQLSATQGACNQLPAAQSGDCLNRVSYLSRAFPRGFQDVFGAAPVNADPRVGLAWSPGSSGKWAIRAGWGRYGGQFPAVILNESRSTFPQYLSLNFREFPTSGGLLFNPAAPDHTDVHFLAPGSLNRLRQTDPVALLARDLIYNTVRLENVMPASGLQDPYSMQYGLTVERELFRDSVLSLAYVGTQGRNLLRMTEPDPYGPPMPYLLPFTGGLNGTAIPVFLGTNIVRENLSSSLFLTPTVARTFLETSGSSSYNSLQLDFRGRRAAGGLGYGAAFTWSHSIDNASDFFDTAGAPALPQDNLRNSERGSSGFDSRLRLAGHFIWEIPAAGKFLRGWQLAGICAAQTGQPFTVNTVYDVNQDGVLTDRLDNTDGLNIGGADRRTALGFAPSPGLPAAQLLSAAERKLGATGCRTGLAPGASNPCDGGIGRNTFRAGGIFSLDLSLAKTIHLGDAARLVLRVDAFNALNRSNFGMPVRILEAPAFGQSVTTSTPNRQLQAVAQIRF